MGVLEHDKTYIAVAINENTYLGTTTNQGMKI